jgi:uncharacterized protein with gpF-like domain
MLACDAIPKRRIVAPPKKPVTLAVTRPNVGIEVSYRKALDAIIAEMHDSLLYYLRAGYRSNEPEVLAMDKSPARELNDRMQRLARRWQRNFDDLSPKLAKHFATSATQRSDAGMQKALRKAGFTVRFKMTPAANDILQATIQQNVELIKSIASEHLSKVQGSVMRSVQAGRDLGALTKELEEQFGVTRRRAALIARSQNAMATSAITRARQLELGLETAEWRHSGAGVHPRKSHLDANGKTYDIAKGMYLDGVWTWPGIEINCRCTARAIIKGLG